MEKVYKLLDWLNMAQAVDWLQDMTHTQVDETMLLQLCGAGQCSVYLNCQGRNVDLDTQDDWPPFCDATGLGLSKVRDPLQFMDNSEMIHLVGPVIVKSTRATIAEGYFLLACGPDSPAPRFKAGDIQALAAKMNGEPSPLSSAELNELEQERAARVSAEAEVIELRRERGTKTISDLRAMCEDDLELRAMTERAETAEKTVTALERQAAELSERQQRDGELIVKMAERIGQYQQGEQPIIQSETPATGLTFPYVTRELEAMRAAALKYWANHAPDKRQPTQVEIQGELCKLLGLPLMNDNSPPRKAVELAAAIKPSTTPDA